MSSPRDLDRLFRGIVALEGVVNHTRGEVGLSELFEEDGRRSRMLDNVESHLVRAREEILHLCSLERSLIRIRRR